MAKSQKLRQFNELFQSELKRLNAAQREAVEQIEGPVLVIAGPGTGKTHILAMRIGNILTKTDAAAHNILCLTFTDAGVKAMSQRLLELIGPEAYRIPVYTFHSFCNSIIQSNIEKFGRAGLEPISDLERMELIRRLIGELPANHLLKKDRSDVSFYERHLLNLFQKIKAENWDVVVLNQKIQEYLNSIPEREEFRYKVKRGAFKKGDLKQTQIDEETEKMAKLRAAIDLFPRFLELMDECRRYDYEDMLLWVLEAFKTSSALLSRYREQFQYFLVDEFQDTNGAQYEILKQLTGYWDDPNIFIVGDDDQSIYEFQGARLKNLIDFNDTYKDHLKVVVLKENYRSSQNLLEVSRNLIENNQIRIANRLKGIGEEKILVAKHPEFAQSPAQPVIFEFPSRLEEEVWIASKIQELKNEGFPLNEVAVLYARHKQASRLGELLAAKEIPFTTKRPANVLQHPLIRQLLRILEYVNLESDYPYSGEHLLFPVMSSGFFNISPHDIAIISIDVNNRNKTGSKLKYWRDAIADTEFIQSSEISDSSSVLRCSEALEHLISACANSTVPELAERTINRTGMLAQILKEPEKAGKIQLLFTFLNFVKKEAQRDPFITLNRLMEMVGKMNESGLALNLLPPDITVSENLEGAYKAGSVSLLTAHSAKGLEFRKVFMMDCVEDYWENSKGGYRNQFSLPDTITFSGEEDAEEARRRLFFVAMTRAKESLYLSYPANDDDGKPLKHSRFIEELRTSKKGADILEILPQVPRPSDVLDAETMLLSGYNPLIEAMEKRVIDSHLADFTLNVSALNTYLRCPLSFYYEFILKVPVMPSKAATYGTALHEAMNKGFLAFDVTHKTFPPPEAFVHYFEKELKARRGLLTQQEFQHFLENGKRQLEEYCRKNQNQWPADFLVEHKLSHIEVNGVPLTGIIDRIDFHPQGKVHLVDYKSGSVRKSSIKRPDRLSSKESKNQESEEAKYGGLYWRQLVFYKILFENHQSNTQRAASAEISYLKPDTRGIYHKLELIFEHSDTEFMINLITETYSKIRNHDFYKGCGETKCQWCSFMNEQAQINSFAEPELESLDDSSF